MGLGAAAIGLGATLLTKLISVKTWTLVNQETNEAIKGQFPAEDVKKNVGANWTQIQALNRQHAFLQFLNGKTDTLTVTSQFLKRDITDDSPGKKLKQLESWTRLTKGKRRPPLLTFVLGDGQDLQMDVFLESVSDATYGEPVHGLGGIDLLGGGGIRRVQFTLNFLAAPDGDQSAATDEKEVTDTRYARAKEREYQELLCQNEYGSAMIGVIIRQRNPAQALLKPGDIVKLPALEGVRTEVVEQKSEVFSTAFGRKDTPQRRLLIDYFNKRNLPYISYLTAK